MPEDDHAARLDHLWRVHADAQQTIRALDAKAFGLLALCAAILAMLSSAADHLAAHPLVASAAIAGASLLLAGGVCATAVIYPRTRDRSGPRRKRNRSAPGATARGSSADLFAPDIRRAHADADAYWTAQAALDPAALAERVAAAVYLLGGIAGAKAQWGRAATVCTTAGVVLAVAGVAAGALVPVVAA